MVSLDIYVSYINTSDYIQQTLIKGLMLVDKVITLAYDLVYG